MRGAKQGLSAGNIVWRRSSGAKSHWLNKATCHSAAAGEQAIQGHGDDCEYQAHGPDPVMMIDSNTFPARVTLPSRKAVGQRMSAYRGWPL